eukprot:5025012-Alexandrium_andersonii.AAC.1
MPRCPRPVRPRAAGSASPSGLSGALRSSWVLQELFGALRGTREHSMDLGRSLELFGALYGARELSEAMEGCRELSRTRGSSPGAL